MLRPLPGRGIAGAEPRRRVALLLGALRERLEQVRLAAAGRTPEIDRRRAGRKGEQMGERAGIGAGQEILEGPRRLGPDRQGNLLHPA